MTSLNYGFAILSNWSYKDIMVFSPNKCYFTIIDVKYELQTDLVSNKVTIKNSKGENVQGITFDNKLDFSLNLTIITKKENINFKALTRVPKFMIPELKNFLTFSFTKSKFNSCPQIWIFCLNKALHRLNNIHERSPCLTYQHYVSNFIKLLANAHERSRHRKWL